MTKHGGQPLSDLFQRSFEPIPTPQHEEIYTAAEEFFKRWHHFARHAMLGKKQYEALVEEGKAVHNTGWQSLGSFNFNFEHELAVRRGDLSGVDTEYGFLKITKVQLEDYLGLI